MVKWRTLLVALAAVVLIAPLPASSVDRYYSSTLFPCIQSTLTSASNLTRLAWFDVFLLVAISLLVFMCARDIATRRARDAAFRVVVRLVTVGAAVYLAFAAVWGLNYRREPLRSRVRFDASRINEQQALALALARETVSRLNELHADAHHEGWSASGSIDPTLAESFRATLATLRLPQTVVLGRPKHSLLDLYFRRAGVAGMTDPFFLETLVASDILPFERPHVVAHEWAHLAGITDEGEANFVGWLACVRTRAPLAYSGWLALYGDVLDAIPRQAARDVSVALGGGPRADLNAIRQRYQREVSPKLSMAGWEVYDRYLKANRVEAGTASYGEVVRLILGTDLR